MTPPPLLSFENKWARLAAVLFLLLSAVVVLFLVRGVLLPFVLALVVAYVMEPLVRRMHHRSLFGFFLPRWACVLTLYMTFLGLVTTFVIVLLPQMYEELRTSAESEWQGVQANIDKYLEELEKEDTPPPVSDDEDDGEFVPLQPEATPNPSGDEGEELAPPPVTRHELRLTSWDGEAVWVPSRTGLARIQVYHPEDVDAFLDFLETSREDPQVSPPEPAYVETWEVVGPWSIRSDRALDPSPVNDPDKHTVVRLGERQELQLRHLEMEQEGALVEVVYLPTHGEKIERDYTRREVKRRKAKRVERTTENEDVDLYQVARGIFRQQVRNIVNWVSKEAAIFLEKSVAYIGPIVGAVFQTIFTIFLILMIAAFLSSDIRRVQQFFFGLVPPRIRPEFEELMVAVDRGLSGVVRGQLMICAVNGTLTWIGLLTFSVPFHLLLAILVTTLTLIPIFGTIISSIPCILFALTVGFWHGIGILIWICVIHAIEAYILNPKIIGNQAHIHPALVVFALVAGEHTYGLIGALLGVPIVSILQNLFLFIHRHLVRASEEEAQRRGVEFPRRPQAFEREIEKRAQAREEAARRKERSVAAREARRNETQRSQETDPVPDEDENQTEEESS